MSLQDIYDSLRAAMSGGNATLSATTVPGIDLTLEAIGITGTNTLGLTGANLSLGATAVVLTGTASYRDFSWTTTLSGVSLDPNDKTKNQFTLTMQGLDATVAWTIGTSFPSLPQSRVITNRGTLPLTASVLLPLIVKTPVLSVTTKPPRPAKPFVPRLQGWLVLTGGRLEPYAAYFGSTSLRLDGTVDFAVPAMPVLTARAAAPGASLELPILTVTEVGIKLQSDYPDIYTMEPGGSAVSAALVYAKVLVSKRQNIISEVTTPLLQGDFVWPVFARLLPPVTAQSGFDLVLEYFGQPSSSLDLFSFPLARTLFTKFGLASVELGIQPPLNGRRLALLYASIAFESTEDWSPTLAFITVKKIGTGWTYHWYDDGKTEFVTGNVWGHIIFFDDPTLDAAPLIAGGASNKIEILVNATIPDFQITGETVAEISVPIGAVLKKYLGGSGGISDALRITRIVFQALPKQQWYQATMMVEGIWSITVNASSGRPVTFSLDRVIGLLGMNQNRIYGSIEGWASIVVKSGGIETTKATFVAGAEYRQDGTWHFAGGLAEGALNVFDFAYALLGVPPAVPVPVEITLDELWLEYTATGAQNPYSARGRLTVRWNPEVLGRKLSIEARASVARRPKTTAADFARALAVPSASDAEMIYDGSLSGTLRINNFAVTVGLSFANSETVYFFEVEFKKLKLRAATEWVKDKKPAPTRFLGDASCEELRWPSGFQPFLDDPAGKHQVIVITLSGFTLGAMVEYLVNLANPNANYVLDAPWTFLNAIDLSRFALRIDPKEQTVALTFAVNLSIGFASLTSVGLLYDRSSGEGTVNFVLEGNILGKPYDLANGNPLTWDAVNDPPPQVPGKGPKLFELRYLAAGQHVTLRNLTRFDSVTAVLRELRCEMRPPKSMTSNPFSNSRIRFDPSSQWMFGLDCTVMDTASIGIILHDPDLYGLVVSLAGPQAGSLAGLSFELLYKKVTDSVGVFRVRLQVPDMFRQFNFGYVSITLGLITVDIFTNGNFKVDLGFPHNRDFSISFGLEAGPFIGTGGIYFGLLDGATSSRVPAITNGTFSPVLELGIGLAVGVGRTFNKGPLKAGLYVQLVAIFEGVLGWFQPTDESAPKAMYYWGQGSAGIIGKLYGTVDFKVIKVSVSVEAHAIVSITFAAHRETVVELEVGVEVEAEVTILFISISFSFGLQLQASFTIGESTPTPWILAADQSGRSFAALRGTAAVPHRRRPLHVVEQTRRIHLRERYGRHGMRARLLAFQAEYELTWPIVAVFPDGQVHPVTITMLPAYAIDQVPVRWPSIAAPANPTPAYRIAFLLMVENGVSHAAGTIEEKRVLTAEHSATAADTTALSFNVLVEAMLRWSLAAMNIGPVNGSVTPGQLEELAKQLDLPETAAALEMQKLGDFFRKNLQLRISGVPSGTPAQTGGTLFPIPPPLGWDSSTGAADARRFDSYQRIEPSYEAGIRGYFAKLNPEPRSMQGVTPPADGPTESMATFLFRDYFLMIAKAAVQAAQHLVASFPYTVTATATETLDSIAALFPAVIDEYVKRAGDTVDQLAAFFGMSASEVVALNPNIATRLANAAPGAQVEVVLGVTAESLAAGNPSWPLAGSKAVALGDILHQLGNGETFMSLATRFGANADTWLRNGDLQKQLDLLAIGAPIAVPQSSFVNSGLLDLALVASFLFVRFRGAHDLHLAASDGVPLVDWYVQAIGQLNVAIEGVIQVPKAYDNVKETVPWTVQPGDDVWTVAATFALYQNQSANSGFAAWLRSVKELNGGTGPFARINVPAVTTAVLAGETLAVVALRLPLELQAGGIWLDRAASFRAIVKGAAILSPLASVTIPNCNVTTAEGQTLATFAGTYDLAVEDLGRRIASTGGLLKTQDGKLFAVPHPPAVTIGGTTPTVADLVPMLLAREGSTIAGQASRFLASGLRMPAPKDGKYDPNGKMAGLYELVGQQLTGPNPPPVCPPTIPATPMTITVKNFGGASWLALYDSAALDETIELTEELHRLNPGLAARSATRGLVALTGVVDKVVFPITDSDTCAYYPATVPAQTFDIAPQAASLYRDVAVRHAMQQQIVWHTTETIALPNPKDVPLPANVMPTICTFSGDLMAAALQFPGKAFTLSNVDPQLGPNGKPSELPLYAWATTVDIRIRTIPGLPNTVEVFGAGTADRQLLRELWTYLLPPSADTATIHILYQQSEGTELAAGLTSTPVANAATYLIKANLSTETQSGNAPRASADPPTFGDYYARLADAPRFLELIWECSAVGGGGYWLQYTAADGSPLPGSIFAADGTGILTLVVTLASQMSSGAPARILHSFNNTALIGTSIDPAASNLFASVPDETRREATVAPGNIAFRTTLQKPPKNTWPTIDKQIAIRQRYSLLAYQLTATPAFAGSTRSMPVGPKPPRDAGGNLVQSKWDLFQVLPIWRYALAHPLPEVAGLPSPALDPYAGISSVIVNDKPVMAKTSVSLWFQDVLGNASRSTGTPAQGGPFAVDVPVGYTDPVIGVGAWPATTSFFHVTAARSGTAARLTATIALQASTHLPGAMQRGSDAVKTANDHLTRYTSIWYQVMQPFVSVTLSTTLHVTDGKPAPLTTEGNVAGFVSAACAWLGTTARLGNVYVDTALAPALAGASDKYGTGFDGLAAANGAVPLANIFPRPPAVPVDGTDFTIPVFGVFFDNDTTAAVAGRRSVDPVAVLKDARNTSLPLRTGVELVIPDRTYTTPPDPVLPDQPPTLEQIAARNGIAVASLVHRNSALAGRLRAGFSFVCDGVTVVVPAPVPSVSLDDVAAMFRSHGEQWDAVMVAGANATRPGMFLGGVTLTIDRYVIGQEETLASNRSGATVDELAPINARTANLFLAGTALYLAHQAAGSAFDETVADAAGLFGVSAEQVLQHNAFVALKSVPVNPTTDAYLAIPGHAALPAASALPSLRMPYAVPAGATLGTIATLFLNADPGAAMAALALAQANLQMPGVLAGGQWIEAGGQRVETKAGDSFASLMVRFNPAVPLSDIVKSIQEKAGYLAAGAILLVPPAKLPAAQTAYSPAAIAALYGVTVKDLVVANSGLSGLVAAGVQLDSPAGGDNPPRITTGAADTFVSLVWRFAQQNVQTTASDIVAKSSTVAFLTGGALMLLPPPPAVLRATFGGTGAWSFPAAIFDVHAWAEIARNADLVDADFRGAANDGPAVRNRASIPPVPKTLGTKPADQYLALQQFSKDLQSAVPVLRAGTGKVLSAEREETSTDVWAVAFGSGSIARVDVEPGVTAGQTKIPRYFALRPLENALVTRNRVSIQPLLDDGTLGSTAPRDFQGIDMEVWARRFLADVDLFGSAPYASAAYRTPKRQSLERVLASKQTLADGISRGLDYVLDFGQPDPSRQATPPPDWISARESLRQRLLVNLAGGYGVDAIVQYDSQVTSPWSKEVARLSGPARLGSGSVDQMRTKVSSAKTPLKQTPANTAGYVNFLVDVAQEGAGRTVDLDLSYVVNEVEMNIEPVIDGYDASDWLTFVTPFDDPLPPGVTLNLGRPQVPVPVRGYPPLPLLLAQTAPASVPHAKTHEDAMRWDYAFTYQHQSMAVDQIRLEIELNQPPLDLDALALGEDHLFEALAQYDTVAAKLWSILNGLSDYDKAADKTTIENAIATFDTLVKKVAENWGLRWSAASATVSRQSAGLGPQPEIYAFTQTLDSRYDPEKQKTYYTSVVLERMRADGSLDWPLMSVIHPDGMVVPMGRGTDTPRGRKYDFPPDVEAFVLLGLEMRFDRLHVASYQNASSQVQVVRNANLSDLAPTRSAFVYQTRWLAFPSVITPLLAWRDPFPIGKWDWKPADNPLNAVFTALFGIATANRSMNCGVRYGYELATTTDAAIVPYLPVKFRPKFTFLPGTGNGTTLADIVDAVKSWNDREQPVTDGGEWVVTIQFFSSVDGQLDRPLLQLPVMSTLV